MKFFAKIAVFLIFFINSCGFHSIYHEGSLKTSYEEKLAGIKIQKSAGVFNQEVRYKLYDLLNPNKISVDSKYYLTFNITKNITSTLLTSTGASGRDKITMNLEYKLKDINNSNILASGSTSATDNYDIDDNRFGTYTNKKYTESNLANSLAQNLRNLLVNDLIEIEKNQD